ncbi:MAG: hypothetical protein CL678_18070 [Bdellovibrionaceae bacterium]|nr:hypothetical protein [Pseudobdellovibrionaceae bacterium]|tara:strand:- start:3174 stop:4502 length:1329 start_codon:yes stop_codon:yes gene_type:complete
MVIRSFFLILCFLVVSCNSPIDVDFDIQRVTLSNGLTILLVEDHTVPVVSFQSWFRVGSVDEIRGKTGLAHLFEHLMFKGTKNFGPKSFLTLLESKGAEVNAFTTRDYTAYYENMSAPLLQKAIELESDRLKYLNIDQYLLDQEIQVVFEERKMRVDNSPRGKMNEALWQLAFQRHPYRNPVIGYPRDLAHLKKKDLDSFFKKFYQPSNLILVVVGDFNMEKTVSELKQFYGNIPRFTRPSRKTIKDEPWPTSEKRLKMDGYVSSPMVLYGYRVSSAFDRDSYALDLLSNILFEGESSRAYQKIVEKEEIALSLSGSNFTPRYPGLLMISAVLRNGKRLSDLESQLELLLKKVQKEGVSDQELESARKQIVADTIDTLRSPFGLARTLGLVEVTVGHAEDFLNDFKKYFDVTSNDIKRVAKKYLDPNHRVVIEMYPKGKNKK